MRTHPSNQRVFQFDRQQIDTLAPLLHAGPLVHVHTGATGKPQEAHALCMIHAPAERVWTCIRDIRSLQDFIKMIESMQVLPKRNRQQELIRVNLRFKIAFFSARFHFIARVERQEGVGIEFIFHSGKVKDLVIRLELIPVENGHTILSCRVGFDIQALGWLVNLFVRHHPEIEWGIHAGSAMSIAEAVRKSVQDRPS